jgi:hypothetical protein
MLMTIYALCLFAQWAICRQAAAPRRGGARPGLLAIAFINAQAFVWHTMGVAIDETYYGTVLRHDWHHDAPGGARLMYTVVTVFRVLSSPPGDTEILSAHALYWYFAATAYTAVWFVVYVTK